MAISGGALFAPSGAGQSADFQEIFALVRSNIVGATEADLDRAAIQGILNQYRSQVLLFTNAGGMMDPTDLPAITRSNVFDGAFGYVRVGRVSAALPAALDQTLVSLSATNRLKGLVLDLRYAMGENFEAAAQTADHFITGEHALLDWGGATLKSKAKTNAFSPPVAILINKDTSGAAEALAAVLRETEVGLILGAPSAGRANVFKDFPLANGQHLLIATASVVIGNGKTIPPSGLTPDIVVNVSSDDERQYFSDAYKSLAKGSAAATASRAGTNLAAATNAAFRFNEADLVRFKREGIDPDSLATNNVAPERAAAASAPVVRDPALARALDLLKGLAVVQQSRGF